MRLIDLKTRQKLNVGFGMMMFLIVAIGIGVFFSVDFLQKSALRSDQANFADAFFITSMVNARDMKYKQNEADYQACIGNIDSTFQELDILIESLNDKQQLKSMKAVHDSLDHYLVMVNQSYDLVLEK